jgi:hypothetical protein
MTRSIVRHRGGWKRPTVEQERNLDIYQTMAVRFMVLTPVCDKSSIMKSQSNGLESTGYGITALEARKWKNESALEVSKMNMIPQARVFVAAELRMGGEIKGEERDNPYLWGLTAGKAVLV